MHLMHGRVLFLTPRYARVAPTPSPGSLCILQRTACERRPACSCPTFHGRCEAQVWNPATQSVLLWPDLLVFGLVQGQAATLGRFHERVGIGMPALHSPSLPAVSHSKCNLFFGTYKHRFARRTTLTRFDSATTHARVGFAELGCNKQSCSQVETVTSASAATSHTPGQPSLCWNVKLQCLTSLVTQSTADVFQCHATGPRRGVSASAARERAHRSSAHGPAHWQRRRSAREWRRNQLRDIARGRCQGQRRLAGHRGGVEPGCVRP